MQTLSQKLFNLLKKKKRKKERKRKFLKNVLLHGAQCFKASESFPSLPKRGISRT